jgi:hypothetical protein
MPMQNKLSQTKRLCHVSDPSSVNLGTAFHNLKTFTVVVCLYKIRNIQHARRRSTYFRISLSYYDTVMLVLMIV